MNAFGKDKVVSNNSLLEKGDNIVFMKCIGNGKLRQNRFIAKENKYGISNINYYNRK